MFPFFVGFFGLEFLNFFGMSGIGNNVVKKYVDHVVSDALLNVKFGIEESYILKTVAYADAKGVYTIGIGLVDIFDEKGNFVLKVYKGLTLSQLKQRMGKSFMADLPFVFMLMRNHVKRSMSSKVFKDLDELKIPYNADLADAIIDFYYNSGSAYGTKSYNDFKFRLNYLASVGQLNNYSMSVEYIKYRLDYLASFSSVIYGSWARRVQIFADRINGDGSMENKKSWIKYPTSVSVRNYLFSKYFYSLKKPLA